MRFSIRFADKIVGLLIILALGLMVFVVFMMGTNQRWFARDFHYITYLSSTMGISRNMPVQFRGFTIGHVRSIELAEDDRVRVGFTIFDIYNDRVREGSLVDVLSSPIGLGSQFLFHPGPGPALLPEGSFIPELSSPEGRELIASGLVPEPERDDSITQILNQVNATLATANLLISDVQEAFDGTDRTSLGRTIGGLETTITGLGDMTQRLSEDIFVQINQVIAQIDPILADFQGLSSRITDPDGAVMALLDIDGPLYTNIAASLDSISGTLRSLERTAEFVPAQLPALSGLITDLHSTLVAAESVLVALTHNPLLRRGVPRRIETHPGGTRPRDLEF